MLWRDVIPVRAQAPEVRGAGCNQLGPPVRQVRRHLHPRIRHRPARLPDEAFHVTQRHPARPSRCLKLGTLRHARAPVLARRRVRDPRRLAPVIALMRNKVLQDHLLQMPGAHAARPKPPATRSAPPLSPRSPPGSRWSTGSAAHPLRRSSATPAPDAWSASRHAPSPSAARRPTPT